MPANAAITINDGAATPVAHILKPLGQTSSNSDYVFKEMVDGVPMDAQLTAYVAKRPMSGKLPTLKDSVKLVVPVTAVQVVNGVSQTVTVNTNIGDISFVASKGSTKQERKNLRVLMANFLQSTAFASVFDDQETFW